MFKPMLLLAAALMLVPELPAQAVTPQAPARVVSAFYAWYFRPSTNWQANLSGAKPFLSRSLYDGIVEVERLQAKKRFAFLDYDPFIAAQVAATKSEVRSVVMHGTTAAVNVLVTYEKYPHSATWTSPMKIIVARGPDGWRISDFVGPHDRPSETLARELPRMLRDARSAPIRP